MTTRRQMLAVMFVPWLLTRLDRAAAQPKHPLVIGWLSPYTREASSHRIALFKEALAPLGWKENSQFVVEARWANGQLDRLHALARELAEQGPAVIVTETGQATLAAAKVARSTPIVQGNGTDLVAAGLAGSLARPGGLVTGMTNVQVDVTEKFIELLAAAVPKAKRVGVLADTRSLNHVLNVKAIQRSATRHRIDARIAEVTLNRDVEPALSQLRDGGVQALVALSSPLMGAERPRIMRFSMAHSLPVVAYSRQWADDGALITYGQDVSPNYRRAAYYVDHILKGAKPGDLPIEQPTRLELVINLRTARTLGLLIPDILRVRADRVIE